MHQSVDQPIVLAIDVGGGSLRAALVTREGRRLATLADSAMLKAGSQGGASLDTTVLWERVLGTVRELIATAPGVRVVAVACTGIRHALIRLADGEATYASSNLDRRGVDFVPRAGEPFGRRAAAVGGRWPSHLTWVAKVPVMHEQAASTGAGATVFGLADWLVYQLTGEVTMGPAAASETGLLDVDSGSWERGLAAELGLAEYLPRLVEETEFAGFLHESIASELGLEPGLPVLNCGSDSHAALAGMGVARRGQIGIIAGTTSPCFLLTGARPNDPDGRFGATRAIASDDWVIEANPGMTGIALDWARGSLHPELGVAEGFSRMEQAARTLGPGANGTSAYLGQMMIPAHLLGDVCEPAGLMWDDARPHIRGRAFEAEFSRAAYESCAFAIAYHLTQLLALSTEPHTEILLAGGQAQSRLLVEILAETLQVPIRTVPEDQPTLVGAAHYAFHAVGLGGLAPGASVPPLTQIAPTGQSYQDAYATWLSRYPIELTLSDTTNGDQK